MDVFLRLLVLVLVVIALSLIAGPFDDGKVVDREIDL